MKGTEEGNKNIKSYVKEGRGRRILDWKKGGGSEERSLGDCE